jgi:hypothetical protein
MAVGSDDPATLIANAYGLTSRYADSDMQPTPLSPISDYHDPPSAYHQHFDHLFETYDPEQHARVAHVLYRSRNGPPSHVDVSVTPLPVANAPTSNVNSISPPSGLSITRPVTPLNHGIVYEQTSPSPAPIVTPRLYSWSSHSPFPPHSPTPSLFERRTGPLTNPNARMSLAHLSSAPVRIRMT